MTPEIQYWCCVTIKPDLGSTVYFWLVKANFPCGTTNQEHYPDLGNDCQYGISTLIPQMSFCSEIIGHDIAKMAPFFSGLLIIVLYF